MGMQKGWVIKGQLQDTKGIFFKPVGIPGWGEKR
jgi:hypothetical protein